VTENSVRHIDTIKEMEAMKLEYQIRCSHHELEFLHNEKIITCVICGKNWLFLEERGYSKIKSAYVAEKNISALTTE
jgi:ribosomal protein S27E